MERPAASEDVVIDAPFTKKKDAAEVLLDKLKEMQIKRAVERFYGVRVRTVRTLVVRGKVKRFGRRTAKRSNWKKAYVTLAEGQTINIYEA